MAKKEKKAIDEFLFVLIAGLLMIVVMLIYWGNPEEAEENATDIEDLEGKFTVGTERTETPTITRFGDFTVSYALGSDVIKTRKNIEIKKSIVSNKYETVSGSVTEDMNTITSGFVTIDILDTNSAGKLIVKVNGHVVHNEVAYPGRLDISVDKSYLKEYNVVEISSSNPGLRIWSSSVYQIEKVDFGINFFGNKEMFETFRIDRYELENFDYAELSFEVDNHEGIGDLLIKINNHKLFKGEPERKFEQRFDKYDVGLVSGQNTISFSTEKGSTYELEDVTLYIVYEEESTTKKTFSFKIISSEYNQLKSEKGKIEFYIVDTNYLGNLKVYTKDTDGNTHHLATIEDYEEDEYETVYYDYNDVDIGTNKLIFEATSDGEFTLSNLEITP